MRTFGALLCAMAVASALILAYGQSPLHVYGVMLSHTWGDVYGIGQVLFKSTPLLFTGLSVCLAYHAGLFNIGAEGQLLVGSFSAGILGASLPSGAPWVISIPLCVLAAAAGGAALGAIPGLLKARFGAHEVISTIMLNFIVQAMVLWIGRSFFFVDQTVHTYPVVPSARMPSLGLADSAANGALLLALAMAVVTSGFLSRTRVGFELRALGKSPLAAEAGAVPVGRTYVLAMAASGAMAGLVGTSTVLGYKGYFEEGLGSGNGFMGIAVALLAGNRPLVLIGAALFFGTLSHGGLAVNSMVPKELVDVIQGTVILAVSAATGLSRRES